MLSKIEALITNNNFEFEEALELSKKFLTNHLSSLNRKGNQIINNIETIDKNSLKFIIGNYAAFSQEAIHMLVDAMMRNHDWPLLFTEIQNNINEEKGSETKGIPHLEIMREGYRKDLSMEVDFQYFDISLITKRFLDSMKMNFNNDDNAFSAGALLAFEGTAIEEFYIIDLIIKKYIAISNKNYPDIKSQLSKSLTKYYIDGHKIFEVGHEQHLIDAVKPYITKENSSRMIRGYLSTSITMNTWWTQLYDEATFNSSFKILNDFKQEKTSVFKDIFK